MTLYDRLKDSDASSNAQLLSNSYTSQPPSSSTSGSNHDSRAKASSSRHLDYHTFTTGAGAISPLPSEPDDDVETLHAGATGQHGKGNENKNRASTPAPLLVEDTEEKDVVPIFSKYNPSLMLENSGSVARDHLASERTFLAYVRTSLTIASSGVALVQLFAIASRTDESLQQYSRPLGATIVILGMLTLLVGITRYFTIQRSLIQGNFPVARISPVFLSVSLIMVVVAVFAIILGVRECR